MNPKKELDDLDKGKVLGILTAGGDMAAAAAEIGITRRALYRRIEHDKPFAEQVEEARERGTDLAEMVLYRMAVGQFRVKPGGEPEPPNITALIFFLKNRRPDKWRDRHEIAAIPPPPPGPLSITLLEAPTVQIEAQAVRDDEP